MNTTTPIATRTLDGALAAFLRAQEGKNRRPATLAAYPARPGPTLAAWILIASIALLGLALMPLTLGWWTPRGRRGA